MEWVKAVSELPATALATARFPRHALKYKTFLATPLATAIAEDNISDMA